jgi:ribonucleoside-diphosphate reductase alpha chain
MKKFIVETYYTCTFKTVHTLKDLNDKELSKIDERNDGSVEVIDVKLNNRKTKKIGDEKGNKDKNIKIQSPTNQQISSQIKTKQIEGPREMYVLTRGGAAPVPFGRIGADPS